MRKNQFARVEKYIELFEKIHQGVLQEVLVGNVEMAASYLETSQQKAIELGTFIEECEGEGHPTVHRLEEYCDVVYNIHQNILSGKYESAEEIAKELIGTFETIKISTIENIKVKKTAVFLPYKASMWDSLESVWAAAKEDEDCEALVIPIPYYDKDGAGNFTDVHYEADLYPSDVPVVKYDEFDFENEKPDMIFIHYPYDGYNNVSSVHPFFYSDNLKKYTECLVYIPYYATSGGTSDAQSLCPVYFNVDYIVLQSEATKGFINPIIPREKLLAFGSPKFDSVIRKCQNPPEPPAEWKGKMAGKKVYFFNTSLSGMLANTEQFFKKMNYVFDTFDRHPEVCLVWRPHPLFEGTLGSLRPEYLEKYHNFVERIKSSDTAIYDETPSIEDTIAHCDTYVGDTGTSVTALFGVAGKELFILDNNITELPTEDDIRSVAYYIPRLDYRADYYILPNTNMLFKRDENDVFHFYCKVGEYAAGGYYQGAVEYNGKVYVIPAYAQDILVIDKDKNVEVIDFENKVEQVGAFNIYYVVDNLIILMPSRYHSIVIFNMENGTVSYIKGMSGYITKFFEDGTRVNAANFLWKKKVFVFNNEGSEVTVINLENGTIQKVPTGINELIVTAVLENLEGSNVWLLPYEGTEAMCWNLDSGNVKQYDLMVEGLETFDRVYNQPMNMYYFSSVARYGEKVVFAPCFANKYVELDVTSAEVKEWNSPIEVSAKDVSGYLPNKAVASFVNDCADSRQGLWDYVNRRMYHIDMDTKDIHEYSETFDSTEVFQDCPGYSKYSQWLQYGCRENIFNSLEDLLANNIHGNQYSREETLKLFESVNASPNGDSGEKIYKYVSKTKQ